MKWPPKYKNNKLLAILIIGILFEVSIEATQSQQYHSSFSQDNSENISFDGNSDETTANQAKVSSRNLLNRILPQQSLSIENSQAELPQDEDPEDFQSQSETKNNRRSIQRQFQRIRTSREYYQKFQEELNKWSFIQSRDSNYQYMAMPQTFNATSLSNHREMCEGSQPCQFYYYVIPSKCQKCSSVDSLEQSDQNSSTLRTVFLTSGMHGNEYIGPHALLYSLKHIFAMKSHPRIVIFPLANPSGLQKDRRVTYPTKVDPNRDFPLQKQSTCYRASSSLIIDNIFRTYQFDLTIGIHNGGNQIGWNWGTHSQKSHSHTSEYQIYHEIGQMMQYKGGSNQNKNVNMSQLKIGTMSEVIYPAVNTFDDWAYSASWYHDRQEYKKRAGQRKQSQAPFKDPPMPSPLCDYHPYPKGMMNGLVFLWQVGPFNANGDKFGTDQGVMIDSNDQSIQNGFVSRVIRMVIGALQVVEPKLEFKFTNDYVFLKLRGCKSGVIQKMSIMKKREQGIATESERTDEQQKLFQGQPEGYEINGTLQPRQPQIVKLPLLKSLEISEKNTKDLSKKKFEQLFIQYRLICDPEWQGKGQTIFSHKRQFQVSQRVELIDQSSAHDRNLSQTLFQTENQVYKSYQPFQSSKSFWDETNPKNLTVTVVLVIISAIILILVGGLIRLIFKEILKRNKRKVIEKTVQQYETGQIKLDTENDEEKHEKSYEDDVNDVSATEFKQEKQYPQFCQSDKGIIVENSGNAANTRSPQVEQEFPQLQEFVKVASIVYKNE